jgi:hypothetical protein
MITIQRLIIVVLVISMAAPASAGPIKESAAKAAHAWALEQAAGGKSAKNPYLWPGIGLIAGGTTVAMIGFLHATGAEVKVGTNTSGNSATVSANEKHNTALGIAGMGIAGLGGVLLWRGAKKAASPYVTFGPGRVTVGKSMSF